MNKECILKEIEKTDDRLLISKILDKAVRCERSNAVIHSDFVDPYGRSAVERLFEKYLDIKYVFYGGYEGAERVTVIFCPDFIDENDIAQFHSFFKLVKVRSCKREGLSHRDYLGALMGLGIKREKIGDILVSEFCGDVIVLSEIAEYIGYNLVKVGNSSVNVDVVGIEELEISTPRSREIKTTVASLRLDCVAGAGFSLSRSKMAEYIKGEKVYLNWGISNNAVKQVKEGDTISIRGKGKIIVESIAGITRKGRTGIIIKRLI